MASKPKEFDLLKGKNELFNVKFDTLTPRPHFIIAPKEDPTDIKPDFKEMNLNQTKTLLAAVESMKEVMKAYKIDSGILSFHRGSWFTKDPDRTFHAHICVDVNLYENVVKENKNEIAKSLSWNLNVTSYCNAVSAYKTEKQAKYFPEAVSNIEKLKDVKKAVLPTVDENVFTRVLLHPSHPKIGFVGKRNEKELEISLQAIEKFAQDLGLIDIAFKNEDENKGCQVCLYLGPGKLILYIISDKAIV